ncbi:unnamed protein product [Linum trigynum]|uniref:Uncharacterized protein n=1 Tax=Linum trigynum TaxID=586398 RepID=A0AAV2DUT1_9ROSI
MCTVGLFPSFALWEFNFHNFVEGRRLLLILTGRLSKPANTASNKEKEDWAASNATIITWLLAYVNTATALGFRVSPWLMRCGLTPTNTQANTSRKFQLEYNLSRFEQGDHDVRSGGFEGSVTCLPPSVSYEAL